MIPVGLKKKTREAVLKATAGAMSPFILFWQQMIQMSKPVYGGGGGGRGWT